MIKSIRSEHVVATVLDSLEHERLPRVPLARSFADELARAEERIALALARALVARVECEALSDEEFGRIFVELRAQVHRALPRLHSPHLLGAEVIAALERLGFRVVRRRGGRALGARGREGVGVLVPRAEALSPAVVRELLEAAGIDPREFVRALIAQRIGRPHAHDRRGDRS